MQNIMTFVAIVSFAAVLSAQDPHHAMGFDQATTVHHFLLTPDGGAIEVSVKNADDSATRDHVRAHLRQIAREFASGNFAKPRETHGETPAGVAVMKRLRRSITYTFEETPAGGRVRIETADATATEAVHEFLRYQFREHGTGDPTTVRR
jgi:hypothetical protein